MMTNAAKSVETNDQADWAWCAGCYRCFLTDEIKKNEQGVNCCPYDDCKHRVYSINYWTLYRLGRANIPVIPERGKVYGLYDNIESDT
ncbi:MAG: hypothetical protein IPI58_04105 [Alphaproteobacteria bacterium]|nr:MAG: hypothetical protein IPI58_04105 [Alphaproteobacteria bacterium]